MGLGFADSFPQYFLQGGALSVRCSSDGSTKEETWGCGPRIRPGVSSDSTSASRRCWHHTFVTVSAASPQPSEEGIVGPTL